MIYTITAFSAWSDAANDYTDKRTFGHYPTLKSARRAVKNNIGEMHENYYDLLLIEAVPAGILRLAKAVEWYAWTNDKWTLCPAPSWSAGVINFSMG